MLKFREEDERQDFLCEIVLLSIDWLGEFVFDYLTCTEKCLQKRRSERQKLLRLLTKKS
jgi:hypothetical protein